MKPFFAIIVVWLVFVVSVLACGGCADSKRLCSPSGACETFEPCGLFDKDECKDPRVRYELSTGNLVLSIVLIETIAAPLVLGGWYLWEPVGWKS